MPTRPPRICRCGNKVASGALCACAQARKAESDQRRPNACRRGYDRHWRRESAAFLAEPGNGFCACGCGRAADMVDHRIAHKGDSALFWDRANWQPMHHLCNSRKAAREEGSFGRPTRGDRSSFGPNAGDRRPLPKENNAVRAGDPLPVRPL